MTGKTIVWVDRANIEANRARSTSLPVIRVRFSDGTEKSGSDVLIDGPSCLAYSRARGGEQPVGGVDVWIETLSPVEVFS